MTSDKIFINALVVSVVLHIFLFIPTPHIRVTTKIEIPEEIEFIYRPERIVPVVSKLIAEKPAEKPVVQANAGKPQEQLDPGSFTNPAETTEEVQAQEPTVRTLPHGIEESLDKFTLSDISMLIADDKKDLSSEPLYLDYYNAVRGQIYESAQANKPYYFMEGSVSLVFTLSKTGRLLNVGIVQERSTKNPILQKYALSSIERAEPFSSFHESMKEQELTLRITISFEK